jgi:anti-sigma factor RsiW
MKISRNIIRDLLPAYLEGEASADTVALVEEFLRGDPELAALAGRRSSATLQDMPVPLRKEKEMEAYKQANRWMVVRTIGLAAIFAAVFLATLLPLGAFVMMLIRR